MTSLDITVKIQEQLDEEGFERSIVAELGLSELGVLPQAGAEITFREREFTVKGVYINYDERRASVLVSKTSEDDLAASHELGGQIKYQ